MSTKKPTLTGRRLPSSPNLQGIPLRTAEGKRIRDAFRPTAPLSDFSEIEQRIVLRSKKPKL